MKKVKRKLDGDANDHNEMGANSLPHMEQHRVPEKRSRDMSFDENVALRSKGKSPEHLPISDHSLNNDEEATKKKKKKKHKKAKMDISENEQMDKKSNEKTEADEPLPEGQHELKQKRKKRKRESKDCEFDDSEKLSKVKTEKKQVKSEDDSHNTSTMLTDSSKPLTGKKKKKKKRATDELIEVSTSEPNKALKSAASNWTNSENEFCEKASSTSFHREKKSKRSSNNAEEIKPSKPDGATGIKEKCTSKSKKTRSIYCEQKLSISAEDTVPLMKEKKKKKKNKVVLGNSEIMDSSQSQIAAVTGRESTPKTEIAIPDADFSKTTDPNVNGSEIGTKAESDQACHTGQWQGDLFENKERQNKFLRLLGGMKKGDAASMKQNKNKLFQSQNTGSKRKGLFGSLASQTTGGTAMSASAAADLNQRLEENYNKALGMRLSNKKGAGIGFTPDPAEGKKFHIDINKTKSIQFDE